MVMAKSAEKLWADALEQEKVGELEDAKSLAYEITKIDPDHSDAWFMISRLSLPPVKRGKTEEPSLAQAATALSALRHVVRIDSERRDAWILGGALLVDHLGMMEESLEWWEGRRKVVPKEVTPLVEQIGVLIRLGNYEEAGVLLETLFSPEMEDPDNRQLFRMDSVRKMVANASNMEKDEVFRPQNPKHKRWEIIDRMKTRKPLSETFFLLTFVAPIVFLLGTFSMTLLGNLGRLGLLIVFLIILFLFWGISRLSSGLLQKLNRHSMDLERALDVEASSGKLCIPDEIRGSKLYNSVLEKRTRAFQERIGKIVEIDERLNQKWTPNVPNWNQQDSGWWDGNEDDSVEFDTIED
jgi:hypothetical protein